MKVKNKVEEKNRKGVLCKKTKLKSKERCCSPLKILEMTFKPSLESPPIDK
jgi:hypothetical protein